MYCTNCGREIEDDSIYCTFCGNKVLIVEEKEEEKVEEKEEEKVEEKKEEKVEEKKEEKVEEKKEEKDIIKNIDLPKFSMTICISMLIIISVASFINMIKFYILGRDTVYIIGQMIFGLVFFISTILLWKSKKIGATILILFILFKMISSIYYYMETSRYIINNLIIDEIVYIAIISSLVVCWRTLK